MYRIVAVCVAVFVFNGCLYTSNFSGELPLNSRVARYFDYDTEEFAKELSKWYLADDMNEANVMHVFLHYYRFSNMIDKIRASEVYAESARTPAMVLNGFCNSFWNSNDSLVLDSDLPGTKNMVVDFKEIFNVSDNHDLYTVIKDLINFLKEGSGAAVTLMAQINAEGDRCLVNIRFSVVSRRCLRETSDQMSPTSTIISQDCGDVVIHMRDYFAGVCREENGKWHCQFCVPWNNFSFGGKGDVLFY